MDEKDQFAKREASFGATESGCTFSSSGPPWRCGAPPFRPLAAVEIVGLGVFAKRPGQRELPGWELRRDRKRPLAGWSFRLYPNKNAKARFLLKEASDRQLASNASRC
mmetsp:Transcript_51789/g.117845  ORF Transcript_51789/g.117845 Transcript_51789/m.117845 type:complete len:108 (+) Transcript_51789:1649-1972(+)